MAVARRDERAWGAFLALIVVAAYLPSLTAAFQFDDEAVLAARETGHFSTWAAAVSYARARPLPVASLAANYIVGGVEPFGYHVVNLIIHLLATFLVYELGQALCDSPRVRDTGLAAQRNLFAWFAAALFACHPIDVQAVTYVVQRAASLATMFYVGSVLFYVRARNAQLGLEVGSPTRQYAASVAMALAAYLSKENAASLPLAALLTEWTFFDGMSKHLRRLVPFALLALIIPLVWRVLANAKEEVANGGSLVEQFVGIARLWALRANPDGGVSPLDYLRTQAVVIPHYLGLVAFPTGFTVDHDVAVQRAWSAQVAAGMICLAILLGLGLVLLRRVPVVGYGIVWIFIGLSVESSILPIHDVMVEHRMYLAMPGIALAGSSGVVWLRRRLPRVAMLTAIAAVLGLAMLTFQRNRIWQTPLALWSDAALQSPGKPRVQVNLGVALAQVGRLDDAIAAYCRAVALDPEDARARANLRAAAEQRINAKLDAGEAVELDDLNSGAGTARHRLVPADPCRGR